MASYGSKLAIKINYVWYYFYLQTNYLVSHQNLKHCCVYSVVSSSYRQFVCVILTYRQAFLNIINSYIMYNMFYSNTFQLSEIIL